MATYKKRGGKRKKGTKIEEAERKSSTARFFGKLDYGATMFEDWITRNRKPVLLIIGLLLVGVFAYLGYEKFVIEPKQEEAVSEMGQPQNYFNQALQAQTETGRDSLYTIALNGSGGYGFLDIADNYSGTDAANLSHYYAGLSYLELGNNDGAVEELKKFSSKDEILAPLAKGAIGDALTEDEQSEKALEYYEKAFEMRDNDLTTPKFLLKAAITAIDLDKTEVAKKYLKRIKEDFPNTDEADKVSVYWEQVN